MTHDEIDKLLEMAERCRSGQKSHGFGNWMVTTEQLIAAVRELREENGRLKAERKYAADVIQRRLESVTGVIERDKRKLCNNMSRSALCKFLGEQKTLRELPTEMRWASPQPPSESEEKEPMR